MWTRPVNCHYAVISPDGSKYLFVLPLTQTQVHAITVVQNWIVG
jgi:hypothetical protein